MNIDIDTLKKRDEDLYLKIASLNPMDNHEQKKGVEGDIKEEIKALVEEIVTVAERIEYIEDYSWINRSITFWERYWESEYGGVFYHYIPSPKQFLIKKEEKQDNEVNVLLQGEEIYQPFLEELAQAISAKGADAVLIRKVPGSGASDIVGHIERRGRLGHLKIKVVKAGWNDYEEWRSALTRVTSELRAKQYTNGNGEAARLVFLEDDAFGKPQLAMSEYETFEELRKIKEHVTLQFVRNNIPVIYMINHADLNFFRNEREKSFWKEMTLQVMKLKNIQSRCTSVLHISSLTDREKKDIKDLQNIMQLFPYGNDLCLYIQERILHLMGCANTNKEKEIFIGHKEISEFYKDRHEYALSFLVKYGILKKHSTRNEYEVNVILPFLNIKESEKFATIHGNSGESPSVMGL